MKRPLPSFDDSMAFKPLILPRYSIPNEYMALELTRIWAESSHPQYSETVIDVYKKFLKELDTKEA